MSDFRTRVLGLAGAAMMFSGMAFGQHMCQTTGAGMTAAAAFIAAEGQTELLPTLSITCSAGPDVVAGNQANIQVYLSPAVAITSAVVTTSTGATEATATASTGGSVSGIVSGASITFSGIPISSGTTSFTITNIRVNATAIPVTVGQPPTAISAQAFVSGANVTPGPTTSIPVAYALNGLTPSKEYQTAGTQTPGKVLINGASISVFGVCNSINSTGAATPNFYVSINEGFQNAFKTAAHQASGIAPDNPSFGTRIAINFTNVPSGLSIYLPTSVTGAAPTDGSGSPVLTGVVSATATGSNAQTAATSPSPIANEGLFFVPSSGGSATAYFEVTTDNLANLDSFFIPVTLYATTNSVVNQATMLTVSTNFAPITSAATIPSFAVGTSTVPVGFLAFTPCQTTLLFPFVSNASGFETGMAIDNTSSDPFGTFKQSGTCTLNFYGTGGTNPTAGLAPNPNEGSGKPYNAGETYAFTLTSALAAASAGNPATFTGYVIAQCNFQYAHGFGYITYGFPGTSSDTMGYLALVLTGRGSTGAEITTQ